MRKKFVLLALFLVILSAIFLIYSYNERTLVLGPGDHFFDKGLVVDKNKELFIKPGAKLIFGKGQRLEVYGKITAKGTKENPITFKSKDGVFWRGIVVKGSEKSINTQEYWSWLYGDGQDEAEANFIDKIKHGNIFEYCNFSKITNENNELVMDSRTWGAIEVYNSSVSVRKSVFDKIEHVGGVLTKGSFSFVSENEFLHPKIHKQINQTGGSVSVVTKNKIFAERDKPQTCADGIWIIDSVSLIYKNHLKGLADDAIDTDRSQVIVADNIIEGAFDSGIEIDSYGEAIVFDNHIKNAEKNGIFVSHYSSAYIFDNIIENSNVGLALRNNSTSLVSGIQLNNNETAILKYTSIPCFVSESDYDYIKNKLSELSDNTIISEHISGVKSSNDIVKVLDDNYEKEGDLYVYRGFYLDKKVEDIFKFIDILSLNPVNYENEIKTEGFCNKPQNSLYLENAKYNDNIKDIVKCNDYPNDDVKLLQIADYQCKTENDVLCFMKDIKDKVAFKNRILDITSKIERIYK